MRAAGVNRYWTHVISLFLISTSAAAAASGGNETDQLALLAFKAKISDDPLGVFSSWNMSLHFCLWEGITCNKQHQRVVSLNLSSTGLVGSLCPDIGNMSFLREIDLYNNSLQGPIPQEVDRLFRLKVLSLGRNDLEGKIPGTIGRLKSLFFVDISSNELSGMIPTSIFNISSLSSFNLASNQLEGSIPSDIGLTLPNLKLIRLSYNKLTGSIPASLSNVSKLQAIEFQSNNLRGPVSVDFGRLPYLQLLRLSYNNLGSGEEGNLSFLDPLTNCSRLLILELESNNFQRSLPSSIANLSTTLQIISLAYNQISGSIPSGIGNCISLILLSLQGNKLTGIIPSEIARLGKLQRVILSNNMLSGSIPASIGNLSLLDEIHLEDNQLQGTIPAGFGNCPMLVFLDLSRNNLSGTIPRNLFSISPFSVKLNLSRNHLVGSLPAAIGALGTVVELDVSENEFSGFIPVELGRCISLSSLYMQGNFIQGYIPESLTNLRGLQYIDFSRNKLSENIPDFFGDLIYVEYLNLSCNNLAGKVPMIGVFSNASAFSIVGNKKLCGGIPELRLKKCSKKYIGTYNQIMAWGQVFILIGSIQDLLIISCVFMSWHRRKRREQLRYSASNVMISPNKMSYELLRQATKGFSRTNLVSESGFGLVYKGKLDLKYIGIPEGEKAAIAVKIFNTLNEEAANCFITECETLKNIRHRNIVRIISTCENHKFKAIVYDFMKNGSLEGWLHSTSKASHDKLNMPQILNLDTKINIAIDVASALDYLHTQLANPLIHCNLKPSNILLDRNMTAHVSNFGLAKFNTEFSLTSQSILTGFEGNSGYVPPEYGLGSMVSTKGDVYSYGIILLEMLTGKKITDPMFQNGFKLQNFVSNALSDGIKGIVNPVNLFELTRENAAEAEDCLSILFNIGLKCALDLPQFRPDISDILSMLETVRIIFKANTGSPEAYANKTSQAAVLMAQRNMKSLLLDKKMPPDSRSMSISPSVTLSFMDIHKATNGLSSTNLLGAGGFGSVYKATFHQENVRLLLRNSGIEDRIGTAVAIKVFNLQRRGAARSFKTEYKILRNISHMNLVKVITACTSKDLEGNDFQAILYEFMDNGSLEMWLHPTNKTYHDGAIRPRILSLHARINLVIGIACALSYLHYQCKNCIIHCDLKPSNILLDKNMVARIADFGLAISLPESPTLNQGSQSSGLRGTTGYIAPEYGLGCKMTTKGDTYSFGILLLEILTRRKPTHRMFRGGLNLHNFVWMAMPDNVMDIIDPLMMVTASANEGNEKQVEECLTRLFSIGLACSKPSPKDRPSMLSILHELESIRNSFYIN
nr:PREDICTED: probable LRR receptor-like serine/threonine-protein kinase At3g47570 isoform X2 [Daucus carota subsp. sativus]